MSYTLQFGQVTGYLPYLAGGAWISLQIAFLAFCGGMVIGLFGAMTKTFGGRVLNHLVGGYVTTSDEINTAVGAGRADLCLFDARTLAAEPEAR